MPCETCTVGRSAAGTRDGYSQLSRLGMRGVGMRRSELQLARSDSEIPLYSNIELFPAIIVILSSIGILDSCTHQLWQLIPRHS